MRIPTRQECYRIMHTMEMMDHIVAHSLQVCRIALFLSDSLEPDLNPDLIQAAALLHDITKTRGIQTHENHAQTGKQLLVDMGYPEVGDIVGQHVLLNEYFASKAPTEAEVVNYADKRVVHDKFATLAERIEYILGRYGTEPERRGYIHILGEKTKELEDHLFHFCPFSPAQMEALLETDTCSMEFSDYSRINNTGKAVTGH
ncbi:MAG: HDIG domain-containing protein [Syntrophales bacterium]|nr:HDIG domain-containing protein [Syntrophales bacterium]